MAQEYTKVGIVVVGIGLTVAAAMVLSTGITPDEAGVGGEL